jgi:thiol-disulfide isomerase/thioredoxin
MVKRRVVSVAILLAMLTGPGPTGGVALEREEPASMPPACAVALQPSATPVAAEAGEEQTGWRAIDLTNALTGEAFTLADYAGCRVMVQTMATWCPTCRKQLANVAAAREQLDPDSAVFVAISVEAELSPDDLKAYADEHGFDWIFAVASVEMMRAIDAEFGRSALVPPSTPHVIVQPDGTAGDLMTGVASPETIVERMSPVEE